MKNFYNKIVAWVILSIGKVEWKTKDTLTLDEQTKIRELLVNDYYIILTRRNNHLSTFFSSFANFALSRKWGYWSHALMNMEDEVKDNKDFRLIEAVGKGVVYTPFDQVFDVHGVCILKPKNLTIEKWTFILDKAKLQLGKPYDTLFDIRNDNSLSCVELCRAALMGEPDYATNFANFEALIKKRHNNLSPDMFYGLDDFEVVYEVRRSRK